MIEKYELNNISEKEIKDAIKLSIEEIKKWQKFLKLAEKRRLLLKSRKNGNLD